MDEAREVFKLGAVCRCLNTDVGHVEMEDVASVGAKVRSLPQ